MLCASNSIQNIVIKNNLKYLKPSSTSQISFYETFIKHNNYNAIVHFESATAATSLKHHSKTLKIEGLQILYFDLFEKL